MQNLPIKQDRVLESYNEFVVAETVDTINAYYVDKLQDAASAAPVELVPVNTMAWVLAYNGPSEDAVNKADTTIPLIITTTNSHNVVIDGADRLARAIRDGIVTVQCKRLSPAVLSSCEIQL